MISLREARRREAEELRQLVEECREDVQVLTIVVQDTLGLLVMAWRAFAEPRTLYNLTHYATAGLLERDRAKDHLLFFEKEAGDHAVLTSCMEDLIAFMDDLQRGLT